MSGQDSLTQALLCQCQKYPDRCFRRPDRPGGQCFPCSAGNCGLGGNHGYGALKPEEIIEREVVPAALHKALDRLDLYLSRFSLHDARGLNEESECIPVPVRVLATLRQAWFDYKHQAEVER